MNDIAKQHFHHTQSINWLQKQVELHKASIVQLQAECPHVMTFVRQVNANHTKYWHVYRKCTACEHETVEEILPVCPQCECELTPAEPDDTEALALRDKAARESDYTANAYRCMTCNTPYGLVVLGD